MKLKSNARVVHQLLLYIVDYSCRFGVFMKSLIDDHDYFNASSDPKKTWSQNLLKEDELTTNFPPVESYD